MSSEDGVQLPCINSQDAKLIADGVRSRTNYGDSSAAPQNDGSSVRTTAPVSRVTPPMKKRGENRALSIGCVYYTTVSTGVGAAFSESSTTPIA
jgi:hypothetical protein